MDSQHHLDRPVREGKVIFDRDAGFVTRETTLEAVQRQCEKRQLEAEVFNKALETRLQFLNKKLDLERQIFDRKLESSVHDEKKHLKEIIALRHVLTDLHQEYESVSDYRRYGLDKEDVRMRVQQKIQDCSPTSRRPRATQILLEQNPAPLMISNRQTTEEILQPARERRLRREAEMAKREPKKKESQDKLVLPQIPSAKRNTVSKSSGRIVKNNGNLRMPSVSTGSKASTSSSLAGIDLPDMFLTEKRHTKNYKSK